MWAGFLYCTIMGDVVTALSKNLNILPSPSLWLRGTPSLPGGRRGRRPCPALVRRGLSRPDVLAESTVSPGPLTEVLFYRVRLSKHVVVYEAPRISELGVVDCANMWRQQPRSRHPSAHPNMDTTCSTVFSKSKDNRHPDHCP